MRLRDVLPITFILHFFCTVLVCAADPVATLSLVPERDAVAPGGRIRLALDFRLPDGWHAYWRNPGDSGMAPSVVWRLQEGVRISGPRWPVPRRFLGPQEVTYGYEGAFSLIYTLAVSPSVGSGRILVLEGDASWLLCKENCVPGEGKLRLVLRTGTGGRPDPRFCPLLASLLVRREGMTAVFRDAGTHAFLTVMGEVRPEYFYPHDGTLFTASRRLHWTRVPGGWRTRLVKAATWQRPAGAISGVVVFAGVPRAPRARIVRGRLAQ